MRVESTDCLSGSELIREECPEEKELERIRESALRILDYAENSSGELTRKLLKKGYEREKIDRIVTDLKRADLVNDLRFAELYARSRLEAGKGPVWIRKKLIEKGIDSVLAESAMEPLLERESEQIRCLWKALQIVDLKRFFEISEDGTLLPLDSYFEEYDEGSVFLRSCPEDCDRRERYRIREKEKARLIRRLVSAGFSSRAVRHAVQELDSL